MRLALLVLVVACAEAPKPAVVEPPPPEPKPLVAAPPSPPPRLWTDEEVQGLADASLARIADNAKVGCAAPPMGKPVDGSSTDEVRALLEPSTACLASIATIDVQAWRQHRAEVLPIELKCGDELVKAVMHAAAYTRGCSPFTVGVRVEPDVRSPLYNLAGLLVLHALAAKDVPGLLAGIRVMEDLGRGRVSLLMQINSLAGVGILAKRLDELVETVPFTKKEAAATTKALSALLEGAPSFGDILIGEHQAQELSIGVPLAEPDGWVAPGGARHLTAKREPGIDSRDQAAATLIAISKAARMDTAACPPEARIDACVQGMTAAGAQRTPPEEPKTWTPNLRQNVIDYLAYQLLAPLKYAQKHQEIYGQLATIGSKLGLKGL